ncbi:hypothetical protein [Gymnodinialimonas sp.]
MRGLSVQPAVGLLALLLLAGCVSKSVTSTRVPAIETPDTPVPEELLLDVGVIVFDPGLDALEDEPDIPVYPEVRRAEALFLPNQLTVALQDSGAWGAVRVLPDEEQSSDLLVHGKILHSDGETLKLAITAVDSRGVTWLEETYKGTASGYAYSVTSRTEIDPFQAVYHTIANDLLQAMQSIPAEDRREVRLVTELRIARSFANEAFGGYQDEEDRGRYTIMRLPAEQDPMLARVRKIRERDHLFIDTLQDYYVNFDDIMTQPYNEWRKLSYEEVIAIRELKAESMRDMITGVVAVLGGIAAQIEGDHPASRAAGQVAVLGGAYILKSGLYKRNETQIHVAALEELGMSLEAEIAPKIIEVEDRTVTLSGSVEEQYAQWRVLLADIYRTEIGELEAMSAEAAGPDTL